MIKEDNTNTKNSKRHGQRLIEKINCRTREETQGVGFRYELHGRPEQERGQKTIERKRQDDGGFAKHALCT